MSRSKERWQGVEPDVGLTWGAYMTGDTFFDKVGEFIGGSIEPSYRKILEIGPGYGRLLQTILERGYPYETYVGLELSEERVRRLGEKYGNGNTHFIHGDAMTDQVGAGFDLVISSATFEHLYPSFVATLTNISRQMADGAYLCIDFVQIDPQMGHSCASFESEGRAFVRIYSRAELERMFEQCGMNVIGISSINLGMDHRGDAVNRILVCASNRWAWQQQAGKLIQIEP